MQQENFVIINDNFIDLRFVYQISSIYFKQRYGYIIHGSFNIRSIGNREQNYIDASFVNLLSDPYNNLRNKDEETIKVIKVAQEKFQQSYDELVVMWLGCDKSFIKQINF